MTPYLKTRFPLFQTNPRTATFFSVSVAVLVLGSILLAVSLFFPRTEIAKAQELEPASVQNSASQSSVKVGKNILEVHLASNGMVNFRGAKVESISGTDIVVSTSWGAIKLQWVIDAKESYYGSHHFGTSFLDSNGNKLTINDLSVGDFISINGTLDSGQAQPTVKANVIRLSR